MISSFKSDLLDNVYPVGTIVCTTGGSPAALLGGEWESYGSGRVLVGMNSSDSSLNTIGAMGGEKAHMITGYEIPPHFHEIKTWYGGSPSSSEKNSSKVAAAVLDAAGVASSQTESAISRYSPIDQKKMSIMQPYIIVNMFRRVK